MRISILTKLAIALSSTGLASGQIWNPTWPFPPDYRFGPCMQEVYNWFGPGNTLSCTAKEVYANNVTCVDCPSTCQRGDFIVVNVTGSIHFNSNRYDPALYIARSPRDAVQNCALESTYCTVDVLGTDDGANHPSNVISDDQKGGQDSCLDVVTSGGGWDLPDYTFPTNLIIPCGE